MSGCSNVAGEFVKGDDLQRGKIGLPWKPEEFIVVYDKCDLIVFGEVVKVLDHIEEGKNDNPELVSRWYGRQACRIKIHRVLKGSKKLQSKIIQVEKEKSNYYLRDGQKRVFYLKIAAGEYYTLDTFSGEDRLASVVCNIKNLEYEGKLDSGGIVLSILSRRALFPLDVYVFHGRLKAPVEKGGATWKKRLFKILKSDKLGICEIELEKGNYTFLVGLEDRLYTHSRLVDGYYPYCIVKDQWGPLYFNLDDE